MNENNNEKLVFELKDLTYSDLISLYRELIDFNEYIDTTINEVSEVKEEDLPPVEGGENTPEGGEGAPEGSENAAEVSENAPEVSDNSNGESSNSDNSSDQNNSEVNQETNNGEAK